MANVNDRREDGYITSTLHRRTSSSPLPPTERRRIPTPPSLPDFSYVFPKKPIAPFRMWPPVPLTTPFLFSRPLFTQSTASSSAYTALPSSPFSASTSTFIHNQTQPTSSPSPPILMRTESPRVIPLPPFTRLDLSTTRVQIPHYSPSHFPKNFHHHNVLLRTFSSVGRLLPINTLPVSSEQEANAASIKKQRDYNKRKKWLKRTFFAISILLLAFSAYGLIRFMIEKNSKVDFFILIAICVVIFFLNLALRKLTATMPEKYLFRFAIGNTATHSALVQLYRESDEFFFFFTVFALALISFAKSTAGDDPLIYMKAFIFQCTSVSVGYFTDTKITDHVIKGVCLSMVSLIGFAIMCIDEWNTRFIMDFILHMVPVDYRGRA